MFNGIRILTLAEQYPGPYATMLLADLGADVIMVERALGGDPTRRFPEFFASLNRNKRSVSLDLKAPGGRDAFLRLAQTADVLIEGFRPGVVQRLGIDYETVVRHSPRIVYVSITGFGQDGPYRSRPAHDLSYQAQAGMLGDHIKGERGSGLFLGDIAGAMFTTLAVAGALVSRARAGVGSHIDVSIVDALMSWMTPQLGPVVNGGSLDPIVTGPGYGMFETADGRWLSLSITSNEDAFWGELCSATGLEHLAAVGHAGRVAREDELSSALADVIRTRSLAEWEERLAGVDVPFAGARRLDELAEDAHVLARRMLTALPTSDERPGQRYVRQPLVVDGQPFGPTRRAPELGEHTRELLSEVCPSETLERLLATGAASVGP